ncbi:hypothetical protein WICMUC_000978 [Wickerhamomyces mucosus]|uniref:Importin N-terminal domain-containing protein n=1 Tax=Wickerhamomyces mucosus TaxID=1378264 RepID=A0A9P8PW62_9ASCO|nr:hypothetical protein WICMUC_000978 [Wickerhamomyces mucosus]
MSFNKVLEQLHILQLPDNSARQNAEHVLTEIIETDPTQCAIEFLKISLSKTEPIAIRQTVLLFLKRIVPIYWSAGFESFIGPAIQQDVKNKIRHELLELVTSDPDSKIRNGASYAVVQIAAVDYPDEWPNLLSTLYEKMISDDPIAISGGLSLLQDVFEDLVTEEQFFEGGVGTSTITECLKHMGDENASYDIRIAAAKLYKSCLLQLENPVVLQEPSKRSGLIQHFRHIVTLLTVILQNHDLDIHSMIFRSILYKIAYTLATEFPPLFFDGNAKISLQQSVIEDIIQSVPVYIDVVVSENQDNYRFEQHENISVPTALQNLMIEQIQFLSGLNDLSLSGELFEQLLEITLKSCIITLENENAYLADFNSFVTEETHVSPTFNLRNAIDEFISEIKSDDISNLFEWSINKLGLLESTNDSRLKEAALYLLSAICNSSEEIKTTAQIVQVLELLVRFLNDNDSLVKARAIITIPGFISKFEEHISTKDFGQKTFLESLRISNNSESEVVKSSLLVSLNSYRFLNLNELTQETQGAILQIVEELLEDSEDDTPSLLLESISKILTPAKFNKKALELLLKASWKDPSNIQSILDTDEALGTLLEGINLQNYLSYLQIGLPAILTTIESSTGEFTVNLSLSIQLLTTFVSHSPEILPESVFNVINPVLSNIILKTNDDQILQLSSETFNAFVKDSTAELFDPNVVLQILAKFLDPELSDSAAMNVGSLVISVISKFSIHLKSLLPEIVKATTERLLKAKELSTIEDLISVLCYLIAVDVNQTIDLLQGQNIREIFNCWFKNFESLTGERILESCKALAKIYLANRTFDFTVDGDEAVNQYSDLIITRSMRKKQQYQQVSVGFKIVKLLVFELNAQFFEGDEGEHLIIPSVDNDGEWEDLDSSDFDKLQSYLEGQEEDHDHDYEFKSEETTQFLVSFFKEIASKNILDFKEIYNHLNDNERQVLTEKIV